MTAAWAADEVAQRERLLYDTRQFEGLLESQGLLYGDTSLDAYLQSVIDHLFPEHVGQLRIRAVRDPEFNAFAVATGNLYINIGALARLDDEAQLAAVLGHEGGHVLGDHMFKGLRDAKSLSAASLVLDMIFISSTGVPLNAGSLIGVSSMAGLSRAHEREADRTGFDRMTAAGYDARAGALVFDRMAREVKAREIKQGAYMFASHPKLLERVQNFQEFAGAEPPPGETAQLAFMTATSKARATALEILRSRGQGAALVYLLVDEGRLATAGPAGHFLLGEGYRMRNREGDEALALAAYLQSIETAPDYAPAWGMLGRYHQRKGERALALQYYERYLALAGDSKEAGYARLNVAKLRKEVVQ